MIISAVVELQQLSQDFELKVLVIKDATLIPTKAWSYTSYYDNSYIQVLV